MLVRFPVLVAAFGIALGMGGPIGVGAADAVLESASLGRTVAQSVTHGGNTGWAVADPAASVQDLTFQVVPPNPNTLALLTVGFVLDADVGRDDSSVYVQLPPEFVPGWVFGNDPTPAQPNPNSLLVTIGAGWEFQPDPSTFCYQTVDLGGGLYRFDFASPDWDPMLFAGYSATFSVPITVPAAGTYDKSLFGLRAPGQLALVSPAEDLVISNP